MGAIVPRGGSRQSVADQMAEMVALNELATIRALTHEESERLGLLIYREQQRARYRPARIARLKAELALLESLEIAERGAEAVPLPSDREIEAVKGEDGHWSPVLRAA